MYTGFSVILTRYFFKNHTRIVKFGLSEKHTKFEKIFIMLLTNQLIYLVNIKTTRQIFSNYVWFSKSLNFNISNNSKLILGFWWLFVIVTVTTYSGNLVAFLTFPRMELSLEVRRIIAAKKCKKCTNSILCTA